MDTKNTVLYFESDLFQCTHGGLFHSNLSKTDEEVLVWDRTAITTNSYTGKLTIIGHTPLQVASYGDGAMGPLQKIRYNRWNALRKQELLILTQDVLLKIILQEWSSKILSLNWFGNILFMSRVYSFLEIGSFFIVFPYFICNRSCARVRECAY